MLSVRRGGLGIQGIGVPGESTGLELLDQRIDPCQLCRKHWAGCSPNSMMTSLPNCGVSLLSVAS